MINKNVNVNILMIFFECIYVICCCSLTDTVISLVAHKLHKFISATRRNSRLEQVSEKYTEQIRKRYHRILLYFLFSPLFSCACFLLAVLCTFFNLTRYILKHSRLCGRVSDRNFFTRPISGNKAKFFWPYNNIFIYSWR